jgi:hypothetical protein
LRLKNVAAHYTHQVGHGHSDASQDNTSIFVRNIIIVPYIEDDAWSGRSPRHHETCEISHLQLSFNVNGGINYETDESEEKPESNEWESETSEV